MIIKVKAVEIKFIEEEYEAETPDEAMGQFIEKHGRGITTLAVIEYFEIYWPNGKIERFDPRDSFGDIVFPTSSLN